MNQLYKYDNTFEKGKKLICDYDGWVYVCKEDLISHGVNIEEGLKSGLIKLYP